MWVKPAEGRAVRFPSSKRLLKSSGEDVPENAFWLRRLSCGDVVKTTAPTATASASVAVEKAAGAAPAQIAPPSAPSAEGADK